MSTSLIEPAASSSTPPPLCPQLDPAKVRNEVRRGTMTFMQALVAVGFCLLFLYHDYLPLFHSDLWGHVAYGDWMLRHWELPAEDPFTELAAGVPVMASAWLSQVILASVGGGNDPEGLAHLFAAVLVLTYVLLMLAYWKISGRYLLAATGAATAFFMTWSRHAVQRPETAGVLCLAALLLMLACHDSNSRKTTFAWSLGCLFLFALWANLHGSFVVGLIVLGCAVVGRAIDRCLLTGELIAFAEDRGWWSRLYLLEAGLAGSCLNPHGIELVVQALLFSSHPNLNSVLEWYPLEFQSLEGIPTFLSWLCLVVILRHSHRRVTATENLLLLVFSLAVCLRVRMIAWYAPVSIFALLPHVTDILNRARRTSWGAWWQSHSAFASRRSYFWTATTIFSIWMTFVLSPVSRPLLGGPERRSDQIFSHQTPLRATQYLNEHPPEGLVFAPQWWGDWLVWQGPRGLRVMATTNAIHLIPSQVWNDYLQIAAAEPGWEGKLDRYRIDLVMACRELQPELCAALERSSEWQVVHDDPVALICQRRELP